MEIKVNTLQFKKLFLEQIAKISDSAVIQAKDGKLNCLTSTPDNSIFLNLDYTPLSISEENDIKINVGDIKKLNRAFDCIDSETATIKVDRNNIFYKDSKVHFKYHLMEDGIILPPKIDINKLNSVNYDFFFTIKEKNLTDLIKGSTFSSDTKKIYFNVRDGNVTGTLTDKTMHNVDSFETIVSDSYKGEGVIDNFCMNFETIRLISSLKVQEIFVQFCTKVGVVLFHFENNIIKMNIFSPSLVK